MILDCKAQLVVLSSRAEGDGWQATTSGLTVKRAASTGGLVSAAINPSDDILSNAAA
jgi:hypothetical protein